MMSMTGVGKWKPTDICFENVKNLEAYGDHNLQGVLLALMLVLVKCYDIKMVLLPFYLFITSLIKPEATNQQKNTSKLVKCCVKIHHKTASKIPNSGFTPGTPVFAHYTTTRRWYAPHDLAKVNTCRLVHVPRALQTSN